MLSRIYSRGKRRLMTSYTKRNHMGEEGTSFTAPHHLALVFYLTLSFSRTGSGVARED